MADQKSNGQRETNASVARESSSDTEPVKHSWWWKVGVGLMIFEVLKYLIQWLWPVLVKVGWLRVVLVLLGIVMVGFVGIMVVGYIAERQEGADASEATSPADTASHVTSSTDISQATAESEPIETVRPKAVVAPTMKTPVQVAQPKTSITSTVDTMAGIDHRATLSSARVDSSNGYATKPVQQYTFNLTQSVSNKQPDIKQPETPTRQTRLVRQPRKTPFWLQGWFIKLSFIALIIVGLHYLVRALVGPSDSLGDEIVTIGALVYYLVGTLIVLAIVLWMAWSVIRVFLHWLFPNHFIKKPTHDSGGYDESSDSWQDGYDNGMMDSWAMHDHDDGGWDDPY